MKQIWYWLVMLSVLWIKPIGNSVFAQVSEGGIPASFAFQDDVQLYSSKRPYAAPVTFDVAKLKSEDKVAEENNMPLRTAIIIPVNLGMDNAGEWSILPNGQRIWRLTIKDEGAIATMLYYDKFVIPKGGRLFIYNASRTHLLGAYTSRTNPDHKKFATEFVAGDEVILEYNEPPTKRSRIRIEQPKDDKPDIQISGIGYGYNYLDVYEAGDQLQIGESGSCMVNINCPEGDNWQNQKKGIAKTVTPIGNSSYLCSGTLINNTAQDLTPYYLSADHCFEGDNVSFDQMTFYFHFESPGCTPTSNPAGTKTIVGAQLLVDLPINGSSDGALLKINSSIPVDYDVYYNGWDKRNVGATSGVGIHHPKGDVKKISTFVTTATSTRWSGDGAIGAVNAHWLVYFAKTQNGQAVTEGGSSGSPLFNQDGLVVGTLSGGNSSCSSPNGRNLYGKLWYHWDNVNVIGTKKMKEYLDPLNSGVETLNGTYTAGRSNTNLQSLSVTPGILVPAFNANITNYTVTVANNVSSINISAKAVNTGATITGTGSHSLKTGNNIIPVVVTAPGEAAKTYTITVTRSDIAGNNEVYVAGYENNGTKDIAKYWENGTSVALSTGTGDAAAFSIAVSGSDVYTAGYEINNNGKSVAKYWKNGTAVSLTNGTRNAYANSIYVQDNDIFVAGSEENGYTYVAKYWKNGTAVALTDGLNEAEAMAVVVSDGNVYVAGYVKNTSGKYVAKYWKNGTAVTLTNGTLNAYAESITISDGNVYVAGIESNGSKLVAKYWKNGQAVTLTNGTYDAQAESIIVSGSDIYVTGFEYNNKAISVVKYWKNGIATSVTDGTNDAYGWSIAIAGNDVYVAGYEDNGLKSIAKYWKNGTAVALSNGTQDAIAAQIVATSSNYSNNANLETLTVNQGTLVPAFNANTNNYTVDVVNSMTNITVSATAADGNATVTGNGVHTLNIGSNTINIVVKAQDGVTTKTYTITVVRAASISSDPYEVNNTLNQAYSLPVSFSNNTATVKTTGSNFHVGTDIDYYKIILPTGYNYTVTARLHDFFDSGNGNEYTVDAKFIYSTDGTAWSDSYDDIIPGNIVVQNGGTVYFRVAPYFEGETGTYLLDMTIERMQMGGNNNANLSNLSISPGSLSPTFNTNTTNYAVNVANSIASVVIAATAADANATISGTGYHNLAVGNNTIHVVVTAQNGTTTKTYTITVVRALASNNANLQSLAIDAGTLMPVFSNNVTSYAVNVGNEITGVNVSATVADANATISGTGYYPLLIGNNIISIIVMAENGTTIKTYTVTVVRKGNNNANLSKLIVDPGALMPTFNPNVTNYSVNVTYNSTGIVIIGETADVSANVSGNGYHFLETGNNTINILVTAPDGTTTKTYAVVVTREATASNDASLINLLVDDKPVNLKTGGSTTYEITIEHTTSIVLAATPNHPAATIDQGDLGVKQVNTGLNVFNIMVTAEDGTTLRYRLEVTVKDEKVNGVGDENTQPLVIYPNPAHEQITIVGLKGKGTLTVFDIAGRQWLKRNINSAEEKVFVGNLPKGSYMVQVIEGKTVKTIKIMIE